MAEPVYVSVNLPNVITIALIIIVVWTLIAAGVSITRRFAGGMFGGMFGSNDNTSSDQTMRMAA
jgi:hypothetical protein